MFSKKEDHEDFIVLIKQSELFPIIESKIGSKMINGGKCFKSTYESSEARHINNDDYSQEVLNRSSDEDDC